MMARMVWSHVQFASTPALRSRCMKAFSPSSTVANPLCGITGSSGRFGLAGNTLLAWNGSAPPCAERASSLLPFA